jgi:phosphoribosylformylglycinamidine synthase
LAVSDDTECDQGIPRVDLSTGPKTAAAVASLIAQGLVASAHDCSDGGLLVAAAEMAFAGGIGLDLDLAAITHAHAADDAPNAPDGSRAPLDAIAACFGEAPGRYLLEIRPKHLSRVEKMLRDSGVRHTGIGVFADRDRLALRDASRTNTVDEPLDRLRAAWLAPLDW